MFSKFAKGIALTAVSMTALSLSAESDEVARRDGLQYKSKYKNRKEKAPDADSFVQKKADGQWGLRLPATESCGTSNGFMVSLDYLIMRANQPSLAYAFEKKNIIKAVSSSANDAQGTLSQGRMIRPDRTWRPGFKLNLGWNTPYDMWDLQSGWMYYYNKSVTNASTDDMSLTSALVNTDEGFIPYWAQPLERAAAGGLIASEIATYTQLQGTWLMNYNMINLELGRSLYLTKALALRTHVGLQNGWIHQKSDITYARSFTYAPGNANQPVDQLAKLKNKFWGIGLRTGVDGEWQLGYGFSMVGKLAASLLTGRTNSRFSQYSSIANNSLEPLGTALYTEVYRDTDKIRHLSPGLQGVLGLNWGTCLGNCDDMYFGININWESQYWWNQFHYLMPEFIHDIASGGNNPTYREGHYMRYPFDNDGALNLEGVTIEARFDF